MYLSNGISVWWKIWIKEKPIRWEIYCEKFKVRNSFKVRNLLIYRKEIWDFHIDSFRVWKKILGRYLYTYTFECNVTFYMSSLSGYWTHMRIDVVNDTATCMVCNYRVYFTLKVRKTKDRRKGLNDMILGYLISCHDFYYVKNLT